MVSVCSLADPKVQKKSYTRARRFKFNAVTSAERVDIEAITIEHENFTRALLSVIASNNTFVK